MSRARRLKVIVEADGGARGNPGPAGYGAVVKEAATGEVLVEMAESIGIATNNVAEYSGLIGGLRAAADLGAVEVEARMDSRLVVEQMSGRWQIKHPGLRPLAAEAATLVRRFDTVRFTWVPRERNKRADALANAAMNATAAAKGDTAADGTAADVTVADLTAADVEVADVTAADVEVADVDVADGTAANGPADMGTVADDTPEGDAPGPAATGSWTPPTTEATRLVLVRHGETELTAQRRYSGRGDVALSAHGLAQAEAVAARVAAVACAPAAVVSSPLARCVATAQAIASASGDLGVVTDPDLVECDFGVWEGRTFAEVRAGWPEAFAEWLASAEVAPPGGESFRAVTTRTRAAVSRLLAAYPRQTVIVVSHVTPIKLILRDALAAGDAFLHRLYLDPAGISIVDSWVDGGVAVRTVNDTAHLTKQ